MGKKMRSKPKKRGSRSRCQINTQGCEIESEINQDREAQIITQINTQGCEIESENNQDFEAQIITQDCGGQITNQDCEGQIITNDSEWEIFTQSFDCFNEDGILCSIISSLPLREAVRTCVLSRRWRHIWTYFPILNFYYEHILDSETVELYEKGSLTAKEKCYLLMGKTDYFIQSVNSVLQQHQGLARLEGINIEYFLHKAHSHHLDAWVRFAVASKAKQLYLHLEQPHSTFKVEDLPKCSSSFNYLKRLDWDCPKWSVGAKMSLLNLETLLDAAPFLEELKLHLSVCGVEEAPPRVTKLKKKLPKHPRSHLKTVEISGFYFVRWQVQIVLYLLYNAIELESITLEKGRKPVREIGEADMKSLAQQVPPNVKLVIL